MKKTFLKFPNRHVSYLPKMRSRRMQLGLERHNVAYKSDGGTITEDPEPKTEAEAIAAVGKQVEGFKALLGAKADATQFAALEKQIADLQKGIKDMQAEEILGSIKEINKANEAIHRQIAEIQEKEQKEKETAKGTKNHKGVRIATSDVKSFIDKVFPGGKGTEKTSSDPKTHQIEIGISKAAENFSYATFFEGGPDTDESAFTGRVIDPVLYQRKRKTNIILDYFDIRTINVPELVFLVKVEDGDDADSSAGDSGGADWILPGTPKPKRSFRVTSQKVKAKKVAIYGNMEDELLEDVASLERWIREDFMAEMREAINDGLLNGDPDITPTKPLGLLTNASLYSASPGYADKFVANSTTVIDQLIAAFAAMRYRREEASIAFVASDVWYLIQHLKDNEGRYQNNNLVYTNNLGQLYIAGVLIVPVDYEDVPATHVLIVGKELGFKIYAYGQLVFQRGLNGEDFRNDMTSYRGFQRFLTYIPEDRENSVMYDTFANIKAGIEA